VVRWKAGIKTHNLAKFWYFSIGTVLGCMSKFLLPNRESGEHFSTKVSKGRSLATVQNTPYLDSFIEVTDYLWLKYALNQP